MTSRSKLPDVPEVKAGAAVRFVTVDADAADRRLDNFLMSELKGLPRTRVYRLIRKGEVRVNKGRSKPAYRLAEGDIVRIPPVSGLHDGGGPKIAKTRAEWINQRILYEDDAILIIDKPSGLAVHGGSGVSLGAIEVLRAARPEAHFLELVHRLDRDTSGCLLIAKKRSALRRLHEAFREGRVQKIYTALLAGPWVGGFREVSLPLVTDNRKNGERFVRTGPEGKAALTRYSPVQRYDDAVLVRVELMTGRTHQIRVHSAAIGHPVTGDERYGPEAWRPPGLKRLFLHASRIAFLHPISEQRLEIEAPIDSHLQATLNKLSELQP